MSFTPPTPQWVGGSVDFTSEVVQTPDDGEIEQQWGSKIVRIYEGAYSVIAANALAGLYNRGVVSSGYVLDHARITKRRGGIGRVELEWQSIGGYLNPNEWSLVPEDLAPRIERHPLFAALTTDEKQTVLMAYTALNNGAKLTAVNKFTGTNAALMSLMLDKLYHGYEHYLLAAHRYTWSQYFVSGSLPAPNPGGTTYNSPGGPAGFVLPPSTSWLRQPDDAGQANWSPLGGIEKITYSWLGVPNFGGSSFWDPDIYPASGF